MAYYHCVSSLSQFGSGFFEDGQEVIHRVGAEHGDARLSEVRRSRGQIVPLISVS